MIIIGNLVLNIFVSISLKSIMEAIQILQIIAFFVMIDLNYSPFTLLFLRGIYLLTTFKIIPEEIMDEIINLFKGNKTTEVSEERKLEKVQTGGDELDLGELTTY